MSMFDINAGCGFWPFWPTRANSAAALEELLRKEGIERACAYPLEAFLWPDPQEANELRLPELAQSRFFVPTAVLNPTLANVLKSYELCRDTWQVPLVRVLPGYHLYDLTHPGLQILAERLSADGTVLAIHVRAQDERTQNPVAPIAPVSPGEVVEFARRHPDLQVIAIGFSGPREMRKIAGLGLPRNLYIELSFYEYGDTLQTIAGLFPAQQLLLGTYTPLFYPRSSITKITNSMAPEEIKTAVLAGNALRLLGKGAR